MACAAVVGCAGGPFVSPTTSPAGATPAPSLTVPELKLHLIDALGPRWYCDPDEYPIAHGDELSNMRDGWSNVVKDADALAAILGHEKLPADAASLTDAQKLVAYRLWKVLASIALDPIGNDRYGFDYLAQPKPGATQGTRTAGTIDTHGTLKVEQQAPADEPMCPICLARGTLIDTPFGPVPVERMKIGDRVWTLDVAGRLVEGTVIAVGSTIAPADHRVIDVVLVDGRTVTASPGHPLPDGRTIGDLRAGDLVNGSEVASVESRAYGDGETFDIAVGGPSGVYFVDGIALRSTLVTSGVTTDGRRADDGRP
jgi:hypothetical protein